MNQQQEKAFNYIYSVADGYKRTLPMINNRISPDITDYSPFYKDIRYNDDIIKDWDGWSEIEKLVGLFPNEVAAFGKTWSFRDIKRQVFTAYEKIWKEKNIKSYPSAFNIDIQMFDAYLLSPNCFDTVNEIITEITNDKRRIKTIYFNDLPKFNNMVKSSKIAYVRRIALPEWNTKNLTSQTTQKERWYERIKVIEQL